METELGATIKLTYMGLDEFPDRSEPGIWVEYGPRPHDWGIVDKFWAGDPALKNEPNLIFPTFVVMPNMTIVIGKVTDEHRLVHVYLGEIRYGKLNDVGFDIPKGCGMTFIPKP